METNSTICIDVSLTRLPNFFIQKFNKQKKHKTLTWEQKQKMFIKNI